VDAGGGIIELGEVIGELRRELQQAMNAGEALRFALALCLAFGRWTPADALDLR
jgi:hypothetical protein